MALESLPQTAPLMVGERLAGLNYVAELRAKHLGDSSKELERFVADMRDKRDPQHEEIAGHYLRFSLWQKYRAHVMTSN